MNYKYALLIWCVLIICVFNNISKSFKPMEKKYGILPYLSLSTITASLHRALNLTYPFYNPVKLV